MPSFLGKTITTAESDRLRAAHRGKTGNDFVLPTLAEVEAYYWLNADNEVVYYERAEAARALSAPTAIGLQDK
jgi:hypothetical protein